MLLHPISTAIGLHYLSAELVCLSVSKPLRADQSPFAASAAGCFSPHFTIHPFLPLSFILRFHFYSSSHFLPSSTFFLFPFWSLRCLPVLNFPHFPCFVIALLHLVLLSRSPTTSLPTLLLLTGRRGGG